MTSQFHDAQWHHAIEKKFDITQRSTIEPEFN